MDLDPRLSLFTGDTGGIDSFLTSDNAGMICKRLAQMPAEPLTYSLLNQLLALAKQPPVTRGFFDYYWCSAPAHPYRVEDIVGYDPSYATFDRIESLDQLAWGLYRLYVDALLYFGNINAGFNELRDKDEDGIKISIQVDGLTLMV